MRLFSPASLPGSPFVFLCIAALLEVLGDSFFQSALHRSSGLVRFAFLFFGVVVLTLYGVIVNVPEWDFGKLLGAYVAFFFLAAQVVAWLRFRQHPSVPTLVGGALIVIGGAILSFWKA